MLVLLLTYCRDFNSELQNDLSFDFLNVNMQSFLEGKETFKE